MSILTDLRKWPAHKADEIPASELSKIVKALRTVLSLSAKEAVDLSKRATPAVIRERRAWYRANYHRAGLDLGNEAKHASDESSENSADGEELSEGEGSGGAPRQAQDVHSGHGQGVHGGGERDQGGRGAGGEPRRVHGAGFSETVTLNIPQLGELQPHATLVANPRVDNSHTSIARKFDFIFPGITQYSDAQQMLRDLHEGQLPEGASRGRPRRRMSDVGGAFSNVWSSPELGRSALQQGLGAAGGAQQQQSVRHQPQHPVPSHPASSHPAPSHPVPSQPAPSHSAPSHPVRSHPAPSHSGPSHPSSSHPVPPHPVSFLPAASHPTRSDIPASSPAGLPRPSTPPVGAPGGLGGAEVKTPYDYPADSDDDGSDSNERRTKTRQQRKRSPCGGGKTSNSSGSRDPPPSGGGNGPSTQGASRGGQSAGSGTSTSGGGGGGGGSSKGRGHSSASSGSSEGSSSRGRPAKTWASRTAKKTSLVSMVDDEDGDYEPDSDWAGDSASDGIDAEVSDVIDNDGDSVMSEAVPVGVGEAVRPVVKQEPQPRRPSLSSLMEGPPRHPSMSSLMEGPPGGRFGLTLAQQERIRLQAAELNQRDPGLAFRQQTGPFYPVAPAPGALVKPRAIVGSRFPISSYGPPTTPATAGVVFPTPSRAPPSLGGALCDAVAATPCSGSRSPSLSRAPPSLGGALRAAVAATPCSGSRSPSPNFSISGGGSLLRMPPLQVSRSAVPKSCPGTRRSTQ